MSLIVRTCSHGRGSPGQRSCHVTYAHLGFLVTTESARTFRDGYSEAGGEVLSSVF